MSHDTELPLGCALARQFRPMSPVGLLAVELRARVAIELSSGPIRADELDLIVYDFLASRLPDPFPGGGFDLGAHRRLWSLYEASRPDLARAADVPPMPEPGGVYANGAPTELHALCDHARLVYDAVLGYLWDEAQRAVPDAFQGEQEVHLAVDPVTLSAEITGVVDPLVHTGERGFRDGEK